jgi:DNA-binding transcriptional ArsR family regulator
LIEGEKSVTELETVLELSQSALSQHLARLRAVKIAETRRVAQTVFYSLNGEGAETILAALHVI